MRRENYSEREVLKDSDNFDYMQSTRGKLTRQISDFLSRQKRKVFKEVSNTIIFFDRSVDSKKLPDSTFELIAEFLEGKDVDFSEKDRIETTVREIKRLKPEKIKSQVLRVFKEHFLNSTRNVRRRYKVIDENEVEELRIGEHADFTIILFLLFPNKDFKLLERISKKYTLAAKIADDLIDFSEDVMLGFLYVPKEDLSFVRGLILEGDNYKPNHKIELDKNYINQQISKAKSIFREGDYLAGELKELGEFQLFKKLMYSWVEEAEENLKNKKRKY